MRYTFRSVLLWALVMYLGALAVVVQGQQLGQNTAKEQPQAASAWAGSQRGESADTNVTVLFRAAQQDAASGRLEQAAYKYKQVLLMNPDLIEARVNLGLTYHSLGQYNLAIGELERAVRQRPDLVGANLFLGIDYLKEGFPGRAITPLTAVLRAEPSNREARRTLATCYMILERYQEAADEFRALALSNPDKADGLYGLGQGYLDLAKQLANRMSQGYPDSAWANRLAGDLLATTRQWGDALLLYRKALAADPNQPELHASLGAMYLRLGKLLEAENEFRSDLWLDPDDEQALLGLAEVQLATGVPRKALENLTRIVEIYPPFLDARTDFPSTDLGRERALKMAEELEALPDVPSKHFLLASLYRVASETGKSRTQWDTWQRDFMTNTTAAGADTRRLARPCQSHQYAACVSRLQSDKQLDPSERVLLSKALLSLGEFEAAANNLAIALLSDRRNLEATYRLAWAYQKLANDCFDRLVREFPDSWRTHEFLAMSHQLRYLDDDAIKEFQLAERLHPDDPELHQKLGEVLYTKKSYAQAEEELRRAIQLDPGHARSLYLLGRVYLERHEARESVPYFEAALRSNAGLLEARAALGQAYIRLGEDDRAVKELERAASIDAYGDLHYLLYVAYRKLGKSDLAQQALVRSQELRKTTAAAHQSKVAEAEAAESQK
jgi:tetratricopeptide (TPR) repeat protein